MTGKTTPKISYCITCKGRLHHLKQTLPANLKLEAGNENVEFVVLDYGSEDGLAEYIKANFSKEIAGNRLRYVRTEAPHFKMAHAKNMAHRMATGDVLVNLDADNFLNPGFSRFLKDTFTANPRSLVTIHPTTVASLVKKRLGVRLLGKKAPMPGFSGRVAISQADFEAIGGYDESFSGWGDDEINLALRAHEHGVKVQNYPDHLWGVAIPHDDTERVSQMSDADRVKSETRIALPTKKTRLHNWRQSFMVAGSHPDPVTNPDGKVGCGDVRINFLDKITPIEPLKKTAKEAVSATTDEGGLTDALDSSVRTDWLDTVTKQPATKNPQSGRDR